MIYLSKIKMFNVIDSELCPVCHEGDSNLIGRVWKRVYSTIGLTEVHNEALGKTLLKKLCFSEEELESFLVHNKQTVPKLKYTNYIQVETLCLDIDGHKKKQYFVPFDSHESLFCDALIQSLKPRDIEKYLSAMKVISVILYEFQYPPFISSILDMVVRALLANRNTEPRTSNILKQQKSGWILLLNIYRAFATSTDDRILFDRVVSSNSLIRQIWFENIPSVSDLYGTGPRKRKREENEFGNYLRQSDSYSYHIYQYFFAPPYQNDRELPNNLDNQNLQYVMGKIKMEYSDVTKGRRNCKTWIGDMLHRTLPRNMIKENLCLYTPVSENGHQVCIECALLLKADKYNFTKCPQCNAAMELWTIDSDEDLVMKHMDMGPALYVKFFQFELPFYITIVNCLYSSRHACMQNFSAYQRQIVNADHNTIPYNCKAPKILSGKTIHMSPFMNSFDVQCHDNAKVSVRLYTARTVMAHGFTISFNKKYSVTQDNQYMMEENKEHGNFSPQLIDNVLQNVPIPVPVHETMQLDGNGCVLLDETDIGFQKWNTSIEIVFKGPDGSVIQTAAINIDKHYDCIDDGDKVITAERACTLNSLNNHTKFMDCELLGDVYNAYGQKIPI